MEDRARHLTLRYCPRHISYRWTVDRRSVAAADKIFASFHSTSWPFYTHLPLTHGFQAADMHGIRRTDSMVAAS